MVRESLPQPTIATSTTTVITTQEITITMAIETTIEKSNLEAFLAFYGLLSRVLTQAPAPSLS